MNAREKYECYLLNTYESTFVGFLPADSEEGVVVTLARDRDWMRVRGRT